MTTDQLQHCMDQLRRFDHDRYLSVLLMPASVRVRLCALYAFDVEMARIPQNVSEPMLGEIRYQWWRETLQERVPGAGSSHEIAGALCETFAACGNSVTDLIPLLDAHARRLGDEPFLTLDELVGQVGETAELCVALAFSLVGKERVYQASKDAIGKMVTAYALISHVRRLSIDASHQRLGIPLDLMLTHDIDPHDVFGGVVRPGFSAAVGGILNHAGALYEGSRAEFFPGDVEPLALLLPTSLTPLYLRKLGQSGFSLFQHSSEIPAFRRQMRYLRVQWQKRF